MRLILFPDLAARRGGSQPEDVPRSRRPLQAAGPLGQPELERPLRPRHQGHLHLRNELRRVPARCPDVSVAGS